MPSPSTAQALFHTELLRAIVLNFPDASLSMVTEFPPLLRRDTPLDVPA